MFQKIFLCLLFVTMWLSAPVQSAAQTVITANENSQSFSIVDITKVGPEAVKTFDAGFMPHNVQAVPARRLILATGMEMTMDGHEADGLLAIYAFAAGNMTLVTKIRVGKHPAHVVANAEGSIAYVTLSGEDAVAVIDIGTGKIVKKIKTGKFPHGLRLSPDGKQLYTANMKSDSVTVIDVETGEPLADIPVGRTPVQVGFSPDGSMAFVSLNHEDSVALLDTAHRKVLGKVKTGFGPVQVFANETHVFVANQGNKKNPGKTVSAVDWHLREKTGDVTVGNGVHGVVLTPDGKNIAVTNMYDGTMSVIDVRTLAVIGQWIVGAAPNGITVIEQE